MCRSIKKIFIKIKKILIYIEIESEYGVKLIYDITKL